MYCNFGDTLSIMLWDRLVCGVNIDTVQKRLLAESRLTFEDALKIATSMEAATSGAQELMRESQDLLAVHRVGTPMTAASNCYCCGVQITGQTAVDSKGQSLETMGS